jgi:TonB family protein
MDWLHRLGRYALDVDGPLPGGFTNRASWSAAGSSDPDAKDIWSYALGLSAAQPVLADGGQPGSPDLPSVDTGATRPSETAVARGVELFDLIYRQSGMFGLTARIQECWGERRPPSLTKAQVRWSFEACGALDLASSGMHDAFLRQMPKADPLPFFSPYNQDERFQTFRQFAAEGLIPAVHRRTMTRSVGTWLEIIAFAERPRASPPVLPGGRSSVPGGATSPATLIEPSAQLNYPDAARRSGEVGEVGLTLRVTEDGRVIVVEVDRSSGFGSLDDAARLTAFRWRFRPAMREEAAVSAFPRVTARFTIAPGGAGQTSVRLTGG